MKCTICDRCKKIIERPEQVRTVTCTRPMAAQLHHHHHDEDDKIDRRYPIDKKPSDIVWQSELCMDCANEVEAFLAPEEESKPTQPDTPPAEEGEPGETVDPE